MHQTAEKRGEDRHPDFKVRDSRTWPSNADGGGGGEGGVGFNTRNAQRNTLEAQRGATGAGAKRLAPEDGTSRMPTTRNTLRVAGRDPGAARFQKLSPLPSSRERPGYFSWERGSASANLCKRAFQGVRCRGLLLQVDHPGTERVLGIIHVRHHA